jgi:hypothetical protein
MLCQPSSVPVAPARSLTRVSNVDPLVSTESSRPHRTPAGSHGIRRPGRFEQLTAVDARPDRVPGRATIVAFRTDNIHLSRLLAGNWDQAGTAVVS